ncbi:MAG: arginyltransferase [Planctomycetota bacterium]
MREVDFLRVVIDEPDVCSYLPDRTSRLPLELPYGPLDGEQVDALLEQGYRRSGTFFYRPKCPNCVACEAIRLHVDTFEGNRSQRRAVRKGNAGLRFVIGIPTVDRERVALFNRHRSERGLDHQDRSVDAADYQAFLLNAPCPSAEIAIFHDEQLIAISIADVGKESLSAVYTFFDPDFSRYSLGTLAVMKQLQLARETKRTWLYLGLYVEANRHLNYKANYRPHQRMQNEKWLDFS